MEYEGISMILKGGMLKHPRFEHTFDDAELESFWNLITGQPDFREFFRMNFCTDFSKGRFGRIYVSLSADMTESEIPTVLADFHRYKHFPYGLVCSYGYPAKPETESGKYLEKLCNSLRNSIRAAQVRAMWYTFSGTAVTLCAVLFATEHLIPLAILTSFGVVLLLLGLLEGMKIMSP